VRAGTSIVIAVLIGSAVAHAQPSTTAAATVEFDRGRALMQERRYAEACAAFAQSLALDPQNGTRYNLAICSEKLGKLATAWSLFRDLGRSDANASRRKDAQRREKALEPRVARLVIEAPGDVAGLAVTLDGVDVTSLVGKPNPVDFGRYTVVATAPGMQQLTKVAVIDRESQFVTISLELAPAPAAGPAETPIVRARPQPAAVPAARVTVTTTQPAARSHRRGVGLALVTGGGVLAVAGLVAGNAARSRWNEAKALCGADLGCDDPADVARGNALVEQARTRANLSTGLLIGGGAALAAGVVLVVTGRKHAAPTTALVPRVAPGTVGLTLARSF